MYSWCNKTALKYYKMKIVIFGANGKTGSLLTEQALELGHHVIAYVRKADSVSYNHPNLKVIVGDLNDKQKLKTAITGADACISALGGSSLTHRSPEIIAGIIDIITTMEQAKVHRFIYLSSIGAGESRFLMSKMARFFIVNLFLRVPLADHNANEERIAGSNLQWTVIRPGRLNDEPKTDEINHGTDIIPMGGNRSISRANVAAFILNQLGNERSFDKYIWLYE